MSEEEKKKEFETVYEKLKSESSISELAECVGFRSRLKAALSKYVDIDGVNIEYENGKVILSNSKVAYSHIDPKYQSVTSNDRVELFLDELNGKKVICMGSKQTQASQLVNEHSSYDVTAFDVVDVYDANATNDFIAKCHYSESRSKSMIPVIEGRPDFEKMYNAAVRNDSNYIGSTQFNKKVPDSNVMVRTAARSQRGGTVDVSDYSFSLEGNDKFKLEQNTGIMGMETEHGYTDDRFNSIIATLSHRKSEGSLGGFYDAKVEENRNPVVYLTDNAGDKMTVDAAVEYCERNYESVIHRNENVESEHHSR